MCTATGTPSHRLSWGDVAQSLRPWESSHDGPRCLRTSFAIDRQCRAAQVWDAWQRFVQPLVAKVPFVGGTGVGTLYAHWICRHAMHGTAELLCSWVVWSRIYPRERPPDVWQCAMPCRTTRSSRRRTAAPSRPCRPAGRCADSLLPLCLHSGQPRGTLIFALLLDVACNVPLILLRDHA